MLYSCTHMATVGFKGLINRPVFVPAVIRCMGHGHSILGPRAPELIQRLQCITNFGMSNSSAPEPFFGLVRLSVS